MLGGLFGRGVCDSGGQHTAKALKARQDANRQAQKQARRQDANRSAFPNRKTMKDFGK